MFLVSDEEIASIMTAIEQGGEFAAMLVARRLWPALSLAQARDCVRTIATWKPRDPPAAPPAPAGRSGRSRRRAAPRVLS